MKKAKCITLGIFLFFAAAVFADCFWRDTRDIFKLIHITFCIFTRQKSCK